jgi:hypothetical protein
MTSSATDLLFEGFEKRYHHIEHLRLRVWGALLGAEQQWITDREVGTAINTLPLYEKCRKLAVTACKWGMYPAQPDQQLEDGTLVPATPEREFSLDAKTYAVMMTVANSEKLGSEEARMARRSMQIDPEQMEGFDSMAKIVAMARMTQDDTELITMALRERGEVKGPDGEWQPLKDITVERVKTLPFSLQSSIREFLNHEQLGWPKDQGPAGKPPAGRGRQRSTSK